MNLRTEIKQHDRDGQVLVTFTVVEDEDPPAKVGLKREEKNKQVK